MTAAPSGPRWLSSAAHAGLDIHKAQALPALPLLCHLGLNGAHTSAQAARHPPSMGTGVGLVPGPLPSGPSCRSALAAAQGSPRVYEDVRPKPLSSISASQTLMWCSWGTTPPKRGAV